MAHKTPHNGQEERKTVPTKNGIAGREGGNAAPQIDDSTIYINYRPSEDYFALRVHGNAMKDAGIFDNGVVIAHKQREAKDGDIIVCVLNGEQLVRKYKRIGETVLLYAANISADPIAISPQDDFLILGKVVEARLAI